MSKHRRAHPQRKRHVGHPARRTRAQKRAGWFRPDKDEQHVREIARRWRQERIERKEQGDGDVSGLLAVASEIGARELQIARGLGEEETIATAQYLYGLWGETLHRFDPDRSPSDFQEGLPSYRDWRAGSTARAAAG